MFVCAVIPFYNEGSFLKKTTLFTAAYVDKIILVNDGSTDDFDDDSFLYDEKFILLNNSKRMGKGYSLKKGLLKSIELNSNYTVTIDADLQHPPELIPEFIKQLTNYDVVIGNRLNDFKGMPFHRRISNYLTTRLLKLKTGVSFFDSQCGYRAYKTEVLNMILPNRTKFEAESEMLVKCAKNKLSIGFVNIPIIYNESQSKMKSLETILGFIKVFLFD